VSGYSITNADMSREVYEDHGDGTATHTFYAPDGAVVSTETITGLPVFVYASLDVAGALATLLVVEGILPLQDAANAVAEGDAAHLIAEAEAWAIAAP
jgi:hypothetical protein